MKSQLATEKYRSWHSNSGRSVIETLIVIAIASILASVTLPQIISARRLIRSAALPREVATQLRFARQQAMSQRQAFTFQYNDTTKQIIIIDHQAGGPGVVSAPGYPNTAGSLVVLTVPLAGAGGLPASELSFGVPGGITATTLGDNTAPPVGPITTVNITFQPDGSVVDANGNPTNKTLFFFNNKAAQETAAAISVLGAAGRIKVWRYSTSVSQYAE